MTMTLKITSLILCAILGFILTMIAVYGIFYFTSVYASSLVPANEKLGNQTLFLFTALFIGIGFVGGIFGAIIGYAKIEIYLEKHLNS
jgi:hypothetical protein